MRRRFRCRLVEIGTSGICLTGAPVLKPGTPVMVETMLLGRRAGVVAHRTGNRLGVALFGPPIKLESDEKWRPVDDQEQGNSHHTVRRWRSGAYPGAGTTPSGGP